MNSNCCDCNEMSCNIGRGTDKVKFSLKIGQDILNSLPKKFNFIAVGSLGRGDDPIGDIDLLTTSNLKTIMKYFKDNFNVSDIFSEGAKKIDFYIDYKDKHVQVNIWKGTKKQLPIMYFNYAYPKAFTIAMKKKFADKDYTLGTYELKDNKGKEIKINDYLDVFKYLDIAPRTPKEQYLHQNKQLNKSRENELKDIKKKKQGGSKVSDIVNEADRDKDEGAGLREIGTQIYERVKGFIEGPRKIAPPAVRNFLEVHGNDKISSIIVCRKPILKVIDTFLNILSLGQVNENKKKFNYDDLFHLYALVTINGVPYKFEKNHVVEITKSGVQAADCKVVNLNKSLTVKEFIDNGEKYQKYGFWLYNPANNNCQVFIESLLKGNNLSTPDLIKFIKQDAINVLTHTTGKLGEYITNILGRFDILLYGKSLYI